MISNYNGFPTYDLGDINQPKFRVIYEQFTKQVGFNWFNVEGSIRMYFERTEQVEAFGKMYKAKIKEL